VLAIISLLLGYLAQYADPRDISFIALFALALPISLVTCIALFIYFLTRRKTKWMWILGLTLVIGIPSIIRTFQVSSTQQPSEDSIRVMSYNVRLFGYYQWRENVAIRNRIFNRLDAEQADITCFQEFYYTTTPNIFRTKDTLLTLLENPNVHEKYTHEFTHNQHFGVVTLSKYPIIHKGFIPFEAHSQNFCIFSDIKHPSGDTIRVYNGHLASIHFRHEEYTLLEGKEHAKLSKWERSKSMISKLNAAFESRAYQISVVMESVSRSPYPVIFAGDLNDVPGSYCYAQIRKELDDSFIGEGTGLGNTWNGAIPMFRIDYLFHSPEWTALNFNSPRDDNSDHFPLIVDFVLNDE
jgi:endonuclease/exonuclease/phosphatase family metal-dependent hydrolase